MVQQLLPALAQAFFLSFIGAACGYLYARKYLPQNTPMPSESRRVMVFLASGFFGAILAVAFQAVLVLSYPLAPSPQMAMIQFLFGFGIEKILAKRAFKPTSGSNPSAAA